MALIKTQGEKTAKSVNDALANGELVKAAELVHGTKDRELFVKTADAIIKFGPTIAPNVDDRMKAVEGIIGHMNFGDYARKRFDNVLKDLSKDKAKHAYFIGMVGAASMSGAWGILTYMAPRVPAEARHFILSEAVRKNELSAVKALINEKAMIDQETSEYLDANFPDRVRQSSLQAKMDFLDIVTQMAVKSQSDPTEKGVPKDVANLALVTIEEMIKRGELQVK